MDQEEHNFLIYLKKNKPYLYETERAVTEVVEDTGFGDVSVILNIREKQVYLVDVLPSKRHLYDKKVDNTLN